MTVSKDQKKGVSSLFAILHHYLRVFFVGLPLNQPFRHFSNTFFYVAQPLQGFLHVLVLLVTTTCILGVPQLATAASGEASFMIDVPPGKWKALKIRHLPQTTKVGVATTATSPVFIIFLDEENYSHYPRVTRPLFQGRIKTKLGFSVTIPDSGNYYVVFDNREGVRESSIAMTVKASHTRATNKADLRERLDTVEENLQVFQTRLTRALRFDPVTIDVQTCQAAETFRRDGPKRLTLCAEYADILFKALRDRRRTKDALLFSLFHAMGRALLRQWKEPFPDDVETGDEFATVLMVLFKLNDRVASTAAFFTSNPNAADGFTKVFPHNAHPLTRKRAQDVLAWVQDSTLLPKWQPILLPHMQTALLRQLQQRPEAWTDVALVTKELQSRKDAADDFPPGETSIDGSNRLLF